MSALDCVWSVPPPNLVLPDREVHVWRASLHQSELALQQFRDWLSEEERSRAARFHFAKDQNQFTVGRGILRSLLGTYLAIHPAEVQFGYGPYGKPELVAASGDQAIGFNLSHARDLCLYAFAYQSQIGIDLEFVSADVEMQPIVSSFFSAREQAIFQTLLPAQQPTAFFTAWTCKEAYLKAVGSGLNLPLNQVEVAMLPEESPPLLSIAQDRAAAAKWELQRFQPATDYRAALAIAGRDWQIRCWQWVGTQP